MSSVIELRAIIETDGNAQDLAVLFFTSFLGYFWENREKFKLSDEKFPLAVLQKLDIAHLTLTPVGQVELNKLWPELHEKHSRMNKAEFLQHYSKGMTFPTTGETTGDECKTLN